MAGASRAYRGVDEDAAALKEDEKEEEEEEEEKEEEEKEEEALGMGVEVWAVLEMLPTVLSNILGLDNWDKTASELLVLGGTGLDTAIATETGVSVTSTGSLISVGDAMGLGGTTVKFKSERTLRLEGAGVGAGVVIGSADETEGRTSLEAMARPGQKPNACDSEARQ